MVVLTRSMAAKRKRPAFELPHDVVVEIAGHVAASSSRPMDDLTSIRATCKAMRAACSDPGVALEKEAAMKWAETGRYHALMARLAAAGNPEACFIMGLALVFAHRRVHQGALLLDRAAAAGHKAAAYVLGLLFYRAAAAANAEAARDAAKRYIAQVEGDDDVAAKKTNRECSRCREQAFVALREVTWKMAGPRGMVDTTLPEDGHRCAASRGCGLPEGWSGDAVFCSDGCRIRHEYVQFFSLVSLPVS
ncbi:hypothetical protein QOZ80_1BG0058010 [Eleusine coracana subsp. coracana]|nr:hypothetical protein QOZ80_1BG0058010 [Eleusine coracana subsp. coracana]